MDNYNQAQLTNESSCSDYKDDGTNVLLDANENAYGPGLALDSNGKLATGATNGDAPAIEVDLLGLNRYPDPYDWTIASHSPIRIILTRSDQSPARAQATSL